MHIGVYRQKPQQGFTLVEVLVALVVLSLIALMSWRALDTMVRSEQLTQQHANDNQRLQTALAQWRADLNAMVQAQNNLTPIDWDGRVLRITRRHDDGTQTGLQVVAWALQDRDDGTQWWTRWASDVATTQADWLETWSRAQRIGRGEINSQDKPLVHLLPSSSWQLFYHRNDAWSNPQSSADIGGNETTVQQAPNAVRLLLSPSLPGLSEGLTLEWVMPNFTRQRS